MSGGYFDYVQDSVEQAADEVNSCIRRFESKEHKPEYTSETLEKFRECELTLRCAAAMLQRVDWLLSGDDGEDCFHERWAEEVPSAYGGDS